eukprot:SAG31_NODE_54_length_29987_cov_4.570664_19_plen_239_part_00
MLVSLQARTTALMECPRCAIVAQNRRSRSFHVSAQLHTGPWLADGCAVFAMQCANKWLLTTIAREEWNGAASPIYITSDCQADADVFSPHNYTTTPQAAAADVIKAGQDINCGGFMAAHIGEAIKNGMASVDDVDAALRRSLGVRMRLGHFDQPGPLQGIKTSTLCDLDAIELARDGAAQGAVLLKNSRNETSGKAHLPLKAAEVGSIAVIGPHASPYYGRAMGYYYFGAHGTIRHNV